tara:strand:- start:190 stop:369 length:180 start_codon:yes stop_codon:yes gene_type:complete
MKNILGKPLNKQQKVCTCIRRLKELSKRMEQTLTFTDLDYDKLNFVIHTLEEDHNDLSS